jgi:hypothetical protein
LVVTWRVEKVGVGNVRDWAEAERGAASSVSDAKASEMKVRMEISVGVRVGNCRQCVEGSLIRLLPYGRDQSQPAV